MRTCPCGTREALNCTDCGQPICLLCLIIEEGGDFYCSDCLDPEGE